MLKTLRNRLVFSHLLPLLIIIPTMGMALVYGMENWIYLPSLTNELINNTRLIARITANDPVLWKNPSQTQSILELGTTKKNTRLMLITPDGSLYASSDPADHDRLGQPVVITAVDLQSALQGHEIKQVHYSNRLSADVIDIFVPVYSSTRQMLGVVRLTYQYATVADEFFQLRYLIIGLLVFGLGFGSVLGYFLATSIEEPIQVVTQAVDDLAHGSRTQLLKVYGPEEIQKLSLAANLLFTRLRDLEQARKQLLANLVHELGRPLGALRSAIQALARGAEKDPTFYHELVSGMDWESARLEHLLQNLSHLYDQVLGTLELDRKPLQVQEWLPTTLRTWEEAAREKQIHWSLNVNGSLPTIEADPERLSQVIGNLVSNAIKFTPAGGEIIISTSLVGNEVGITVSDTGPGISSEEQEKIFSPFYRGSLSRRFPQGMGLGLSIARDLVRAHGGRMEIGSKIGAGSQFTVWLPAQTSN